MVKLFLARRGAKYKILENLCNMSPDEVLNQKVIFGEGRTKFAFQ